MKILVWGNTFPLVGGIERFVDDLARGLSRRGHDILVLSDGKRVETIDDRPYRLQTVPMAEPILESNPAQVLATVMAARRAIKTFAPDVIHCNPSGLETPILVLAALNAGIPLATTVHMDLSLPNVAELGGTLAKVIEASSRVVAVSRHVQALAIRTAIFRNHDVGLIENALPVKTGFLPPPPGKTILCLGRLVREKGMDLMIAAMPEILREHPEAILQIGGAGPQTKTLKAQIEASGLSRSVELLGWIQPEDVHEKMKAVQIVGFPSRWQEPFGLVAFEAALAGRPCVAFNVGGLSSIIEPGITGELAQPEDTSDLAGKINALLSDPARASRLGANALERYKSGVEFEAMLDQYEVLFDDLASGAVSAV
jgi:glycogen(starch) synthase